MPMLAYRHFITTTYYVSPKIENTRRFSFASYANRINVVKRKMKLKKKDGSISKSNTNRNQFELKQCLSMKYRNRTQIESIFRTLKREKKRTFFFFVGNYEPISNERLEHLKTKILITKFWFNSFYWIIDIRLHERKNWLAKLQHTNTIFLWT